MYKITPLCQDYETMEMQKAKQNEVSKEYADSIAADKKKANNGTNEKNNGSQLQEKSVLADAIIHGLKEGGIKEQRYKTRLEWRKNNLGY